MMNGKENGIQAVSVSDHGLESCTKEKMKRSVLGSWKAEVESVAEKQKPFPKVSTCDICFKSFGCGKALGGHRRSHFLKQQKKVKICSTENHSSKPGDNNIRAICDFDDVDGKHICCICKKEFPTKNALFGHMRSHPERPWRGVSPPTQKHSYSPSSSYYYSSSSISFNSDSMEKNKEDHDADDSFDGGQRVIAPDEHRTDVVDLSKLISPSWLNKDTRGRASIGGYQAAETLYYMSSLRYFRGESNRVFPKKDEVLPKSAPALIKERKRKNGESLPCKKDKVKKIKFFFKSEVQLGYKTDGVGEFDKEGNDLNRSKGLSESGVEYNNHAEKKVVNEDFVGVNGRLLSPTRGQEHAGPSDVKKNTDKKGKSSCKLVLNSRTKDSESENASQEKEDKYKCNACGKGFPTFQGLGGHRSIHKEKNIVSIDEPSPLEAVAEQNNSSSSSNMHKMEEPLLTEATLADQPCQSSGVKKLNFDLNELPSAMED